MVQGGATQVEGGGAAVAHYTASSLAGEGGVAGVAGCRFQKELAGAKGRCGYSLLSRKCKLTKTIYVTVPLKSV